MYDVLAAFNLCFQVADFAQVLSPLFIELFFISGGPFDLIDKKVTESACQNRRYYRPCNHVASHVQVPATIRHFAS